MKKLCALFTILFGLIVVDACQTLGLKMGAKEINPLHQYLNSQGVTFIDVLIKLSLPLLLFLITIFAFTKAKGNLRIPFYLIFVSLTIFYGCVVVRNLLLFVPPIHLKIGFLITLVLISTWIKALGKRR